MSQLKVFSVSWSIHWFSIGSGYLTECPKRLFSSKERADKFEKELLESADLLQMTLKIKREELDLT